MLFTPNLGINDGKINWLLKQLCQLYDGGCVDFFRKCEVDGKFFAAPKWQVPGDISRDLLRFFFAF